MAGNGECRVELTYVHLHVQRLCLRLIGKIELSIIHLSNHFLEEFYQLVSQMILHPQIYLEVVSVIMIVEEATERKRS